MASLCPQLPRPAAPPLFPSRYHPVQSVHPCFRHRAEKHWTVNPLDSAFTRCSTHNSFRMCIYENCRGCRGSYRNFRVLNSNLLTTLHPPLATSPLATGFAVFASCYVFCFHANTNCPICKSFVLIFLQQYRGVVGSHFPFSLFHFLPVLHWNSHD